MIGLSDRIKSAGFENAREFAKLSGIHIQTLYCWHRKQPRKLELVIKGVQYEKLLRGKP